MKFYDVKDSADKYTVWESPSVSVRERHYVTDMNLTEKDSLISFNKKITRLNPESEKPFAIKSVNFLGYFFWSQLMNLPLADRAWNGVSTIISQLV